MTAKNSPTAPTCKEGSPLKSCNDDLEAGNCTKENATANNGYFGRQYQNTLLPEVRITSADERPSKTKFRIRDVSPIEVPRHTSASSSTCYRILIPETTTEKLVLFICLTVLCTLIISLIYFLVKIECIFEAEEKTCKSKYS